MKDERLRYTGRKPPGEAFKKNLLARRDSAMVAKRKQ
jgi:hypothetical protein